MCVLSCFLYENTKRNTIIRYCRILVTTMWRHLEEVLFRMGTMSELYIIPQKRLRMYIACSLYTVEDVN